MTNFLNEIKRNNIISIIGLAKNVSKTTTLNYIIKNLQGYTLGLTSIGRDGEKYDVITQLPKPRIFIKKGTIVATARQSFEASEVQMNLLKKTKYNTPLGEILILKALNDGYIELAGPSINKYLQQICIDLKNLGCNLILIDGAFDRRSYATPIISDATILSTGASVSEDMENVINLTDHTLKLLNLEGEEDKQIRDLSFEIFKKANVGIIDDKKSVKLLDMLTSLDAAKEIINYLDEKSQYLVMKGALTDKFLENLMTNTTKYKGLTILVEDPTKLFLSRKIKDKFQKKGGIIKVLKNIKIIAVTINPTSPLGYKFEKNTFLDLMKKKLNVPVFDLGADN
jgi:hypothetical protein